MTYSEQHFHSVGYLSYNRAQLRHLESLGLLWKEKSVLELGVGIGDYTQWLVAQGASVIAVEARIENIAVFLERVPDVPVARINLDHPNGVLSSMRFDVVMGYGILYHLQDPCMMLKWASERCDMAIFETRVSWGTESQLNSTSEDVNNPTAAFGGMGCRPTRQWVWDALKAVFPCVYATTTQPSHVEFPTNWMKSGDMVRRAIFVASHHLLGDNLKLVGKLPMYQKVAL